MKKFYLLPIKIITHLKEGSLLNKISEVLIGRYNHALRHTFKKKLFKFIPEMIIGCISYHQYKKINDKSIDYINKIPKVIHRTLLYDNKITLAEYFIIKKFNALTEDYIKVLWKEKDILEILDEAETKVFLSYKYRIQKADFARYIIVKKFGGIYADLDVKLSVSLTNLLQEHKEEFIALEEYFQVKPRNIPSIRKRALPKEKWPEARLRIANYFFASSPNSMVLNDILELSYKRKDLSITNETDDILFITGPDVVTTVIDEKRKYYESNSKLKILWESDDIIHICVGHWLSFFKDG